MAVTEKLTGKLEHSIWAAEGCDVITGGCLTVINAWPVLSLACAVQLASVNAITLYVFVLAGEALMTYGLVVIPVIVTGVVPSLYVNDQGCVPVNTTLIGVELPLQIVADPVTWDVGRGLTVIVAAPEMSPGWAVQLLSFKAVMV